jgi:nitroreductase
MDPNENIKRQRELAAQLVANDQSVKGYYNDLDDAATELAELVQALDEWRLKGGFDPYADAESELLASMRAIVNYNLADEERDYVVWRDENPDEDEQHHIVHHLRTVDRALTELMDA